MPSLTAAAAIAVSARSPYGCCRARTDVRARGDTQQDTGVEIGAASRALAAAWPWHVALLRGPWVVRRRRFGRRLGRRPHRVLVPREVGAHRRPAALRLERKPRRGGILSLPLAAERLRLGARFERRALFALAVACAAPR